MVGYQGGHAYTQVYVKAIAQFACNALYDTFAFVVIFRHFNVSA